MNAELEEALTPSLRRLLEIFEEEGVMTDHDIAESMECKLPTASSRRRSLAKTGLIKQLGKQVVDMPGHPAGCVFRTTWYATRNPTTPI